MVITPNLTVGLALSNPTPAGGLGNQPTATLTILNDDNAVSFSSTFYTVLKKAPNGMATIDVVRQGGTGNTCTVDFCTTTNGTAIPVTDYIPASGTVVFNPAIRTRRSRFPIINNGLAEGNQTVGLALTNAVNTLLYAPSNATLTIIDTTPAPGRLSFSATNYVVSSTDGTNAYVTVVRTNGSVGSVSVKLCHGSAARPCRALTTSVSGSVTFGAGETVKTIPVPLVTNNLVQGPVSFSVVLTNPTGGATLIDPTNTTVTILNNNFGVSVPQWHQLCQRDQQHGHYLCPEGWQPTNVFQVNFATTNGTALAGINYNSTTGTLAFASGEILKTISVPLINQQLTTNLTFGMTLSSPTAGAPIGVTEQHISCVPGRRGGIEFHQFGHERVQGCRQRHHHRRLLQSGY